MKKYFSVRNFISFFTILFISIFFVLFFFWPVAHILHGGFLNSSGDFTFFYMLEVFRNPFYRVGLLNSVRIAICTTLLSMIVALPLAWLTDHYEFTGKKFFSGALLLPLILAPFVGALGMQCIFGRYGAVNTLLEHLHILSPGMGVDWFAGGFGGVVFLEAMHLFPILYLNITAALANVDPMLLEASEDYGCTGFARFRKIIFPLIKPGVFAGGTLVFVWSFTELGTPLMFNYGRVTAVQIFSGLNDLGSNPMPYALVGVMLVIAAGLYLLAKVIWGRDCVAMTGKAGRKTTLSTLHGWKNFAVVSFFLGVVLFSLLPHCGVIGMAIGKSWYHTVLPQHPGLNNFIAALGHNLTIPSIINSMRYASVAVVVAVLFGIFSARIIVRGKTCWSWILDCTVMLPLAVPGLVLAFGYLALSQKGQPFHFMDPVQNPTILLIISYAVRRLPYIVRAAVAGLQQTSESLEEAGASLGAGAMTIFRKITMPLIAANLLAGAILAFSFSMLEVSDSLVLAHKAAYFPITKALYELSSLLGQGPSLAAALGVWTMAFLGLSMLTASALLGKKMGALFR
ncbi:MAG: iron ABC transporter permease [Lentisphaeria bacterium]